MTKAATNKKRNRASNPVSPGLKPRARPAAKEALPNTKNKVLAALTRPAAEEPCIVGVGASAGGFEAIKTLLSMTPPDSGLAFVVIQHLDPTQRSLATELFAKRTRMAVAEAEDGMQVQTGHVYTVPAGQEVTIQGGVLHLATARREHGRRMPIDHFFHSLGEDQRQKGIGIVLSGTGADGTLGLRTIVGNGGIVLVQAPDSAQFEGMPQSAIATGLATHVLTVDDMPAVLMSYARHPYAAQPDEPAGFQPRLSAPQLTQAARVAQQIIFDRFAPATVLVDRKFEALYFSGPTDRFLVQPRGAPTHNLLTLLRESLRSRLRTAMSEAVTTNTTVVSGNAQVKRGDGYDPVRLTVVPSLSGEAHRLFLVVFEDEPKPPTSQRRSTGESTLVKQLEEELDVTRADLRATVESLEASNEELKASNEEVVSINEELQSSNEELQSSKEELRSLNEELHTVNQQLQAKVGELETSNNDLRNVLASSELATLCLDRDLLIKWFSPAARKMLGLIANDVGRPVSVFGTPLLGETLMVAVRTVLARPGPVQAEVQGEDDRWYLRRTLPYQGENQQVDGVIVTFTDITDSKRSLEERAKQLRTFAFELTRAEESERQAIARDLHDDLGQLLSVVRLKLVKLQRGGEQADAARIMKEIDELVERAERSIRSLALELSPPVLYELGLIPALEWLAEEMKSNYGLSIEIDDDGAAKSLGQATRAILFRAIRELLINVAKHAGVGSARVIARRVGDGLVATVSDAGAGFDPGELQTELQRGFGLTSVRERLAYIGGSLQIASRPGHGTEVTLAVPLQKQEQLVRGGAG